ncbi:MAG: hypothetical protein AB1540_07600 [Bdellovibrionota bacterium]
MSLKVQARWPVWLTAIWMVVGMLAIAVNSHAEDGDTHLQLSPDPAPAHFSTAHKELWERLFGWSRSSMNRRSAVLSALDLGEFKDFLALPEVRQRLDQGREAALAYYQALPNTPFYDQAIQAGFDLSYLRKPIEDSLADLDLILKENQAQSAVSEQEIEMRVQQEMAEKHGLDWAKRTSDLGVGRSLREIRHRIEEEEGHERARGHKKETRLKDEKKAARLMLKIREQIKNALEPDQNLAYQFLERELLSLYPNFRISFDDLQTLQKFQVGTVRKDGSASIKWNTPPEELFGPPFWHDITAVFVPFIIFPPEASRRDEVLINTQGWRYDPLTVTKMRLVLWADSLETKLVPLMTQKNGFHINRNDSWKKNLSVEKIKTFRDDLSRFRTKLMSQTRLENLGIPLGTEVSSTVMYLMEVVAQTHPERIQKFSPSELLLWSMVERYGITNLAKALEAQDHGDFEGLDTHPLLKHAQSDIKSSSHPKSFASSGDALVTAGRGIDSNGSENPGTGLHLRVSGHNRSQALYLDIPEEDSLPNASSVDLEQKSKRNPSAHTIDVELTEPLPVSRGMVTLPTPRGMELSNLEVSIGGKKIKKESGFLIYRDKNSGAYFLELSSLRHTLGARARAQPKITWKASFSDPPAPKSKLRSFFSGRWKEAFSSSASRRLNKKLPQTLLSMDKQLVNAFSEDFERLGLTAVSDELRRAVKSSSDLSAQQVASIISEQSLYETPPRPKRTTQEPGEFGVYSNYVNKQGILCANCELSGQFYEDTMNQYFKTKGMNDFEARPRTTLVLDAGEDTIFPQDVLHHQTDLVYKDETLVTVDATPTKQLQPDPPKKEILNPAEKAEEKIAAMKARNEYWAAELEKDLERIRRTLKKSGIRGAANPKDPLALLTRLARITQEVVGGKLTIDAAASTLGQHSPQFASTPPRSKQEFFEAAQGELEEIENRLKNWASPRGERVLSSRGGAYHAYLDSDVQAAVTDLSDHLRSFLTETLLIQPSTGTGCASSAVDNFLSVVPKPAY